MKGTRSWLIVSLFCCGLFSLPGCHRARVFQDGFRTHGLAGWEAYEGNWSAFSGGVRNNSNARGAKLLLRKHVWSDARVEVDLQEIGLAGDAGIILRANDVEEGVDAYNGYYVGLRNQDSHLIIGRADHGWVEYQSAPFAPGIKPNHWYHLSVVAFDCGFVATVTEAHTPAFARVGMQEHGCVREGNIGLRSYFSGGIWRNFSVRPVLQQEWKEASTSQRMALLPETPSREAQMNSPARIRSVLGNAFEFGATASRPKFLAITPIGDIPLAVSTKNRVRIQGSVTVPSGTVYIQDSTGVAVLQGTPQRDLHIGDELEVIGTPKIEPFRTTLSDAAIVSVRSREPLPPVAVTAAQVIAGDYANRYVELEGTLDGVPKEVNGVVSIEFSSQGQRFQARIPQNSPPVPLGTLLPGSVARIRGVAAVTPEANAAFFPFVMLAQSSGDLLVLSGPPWWSIRRILEFSFSVMALLLLATLIYWKVAREQLHAVTEERSRLAREIHDTLAQSFSAIAFQLDSMILSGALSDRDSGPIRLAMQMAKQSRKDAQLTITTLRSMQSQSSLETMVASVLEPICDARGVRFSMIGTSASTAISPDVTHQVLRIVQEAASNAVRHSGGTHLTAEVVVKDASLQVSVMDNGAGMGRPHQPEDHSHFGILGMQERARAIHGTLVIHSESTGTRVVLSFPRGHYNGQSAGARIINRIKRYREKSHGATDPCCDR